jgi:hypothetical protein
MVRQLINNRGNYAANQFVIDTINATYFQSYRSVVCKILTKSGKVVVSNYWDFSNTTRKHLYIFLAQNGHSHLCSAKDMRKAIKEGEVTLVNVPSLNID